MADEKLVAFIKQARLSGKRDDEITAQLLAVGWRDQAVKEAFEMARDSSKTQSQSVQKEAAKTAEGAAAATAAKAALATAPATQAGPQKIEGQAASPQKKPGFLASLFGKKQPQGTAQPQAEATHQPIAQQTAVQQATQPVSQPQPVTAVETGASTAPAQKPAEQPQTETQKPEGQPQAGLQKTEEKPQAAPQKTQAAQKSPSPVLPKNQKQAVSPPSIPAARQPPAQKPEGQPQAGLQKTEEKPQAAQVQAAAAEAEGQPQLQKSLWPSGSAGAELPPELENSNAVPESQAKPAKEISIRLDAPTDFSKIAQFAALALLVILAAAAFYYIFMLPQPSMQISSQGAVQNASQQASAGGQNPTPQSASSELARLINTGRNSGYFVNYLANGSDTMGITQYAKGDAVRTDTVFLVLGQKKIISSVYQIGGKYYLCSPGNAGFSCAAGPPSINVYPSFGEVAADPGKYSPVSAGTMQAAGITASCYAMANLSGSAVKACFSPDGVPLYMKFTFTFGTGKEIELAASSYKTGVPDSDFELPAIPANGPQTGSAQPQQAAAQKNTTQATTALQTTAKTNTTTAFAPQTTAKKNTTQTPAAPQATAQPAQNQSQQKFTRYGKFLSSTGMPLEDFCNERGGGFYRAHYKEYWGGECLSEKGKDGYSNITEFKPRCDFIQCCFKGLLGEYSISYDYFECGYYN